MVKKEERKSYIPFSTCVEEETIQIEKVTDPFGNTLEIPKFGCLTWQEQQDLKTYELPHVSRSNSQEISSFEYKKDVVVILLRSRFDIPKEVKASDILTYPSGKPFKRETVDALYTFFYKEITRDGVLTPDVQIYPWEVEEKKKKMILEMAEQKEQMLFKEQLNGGLSSGNLTTTSPTK